MTIFSSWLCIEYQYESDVDGGISTHSYLANDLRVRCSSGSFTSVEHGKITSIAIAFVRVWPVGMVLLFAAILLPCRGSLHAHHQTALARATSFLHKDDKVDYFYWELVELVRRTVRIGWVVTIPTEHTFLRLMFAVLLSVASLTLLLSTHQCSVTGASTYIYLHLLASTRVIGFKARP